MKEKKPTSVTIGIVQSGPVYLDLSATMEKAEGLINEATAQGVQLLAFGETWLTGYPAWLDYVPNAALWDYTPTKKVHARIWENGVTVPGPEIDQLSQWAKKYRINLCIGVNEKVTSGQGNGTIYNSLIIINDQGKLANHHRKLMPTYTEKMVYGLGDGSGLKAVDTSAGRVGGLICWEHWMPLTRQALHNSGEEIHIALWPNVHEMLQVASRHYAFEGRCFVVSVGQIMAVKELPEEFELPPALAKDQEKLLLKGGSCVIGPDGHYVMEPVYEQGGLLIQKIDLEKARQEKMTLDVSGHYARPDIFDFDFSTERKT